MENEEKTYQIKCPKCQSAFDCKPEIDKWKMELVQASHFLDKLIKVMENKNEN